ncbi:MAG: PilZ domain-containing protein [Omnitrophica bacterium]|nr:PilZ domain-containing protein [Candidatus Omnitrophota bacterium]
MTDKSKKNNSHEKKEEPQEKRKFPRVKKGVTVQYSSRDLPQAGVDICQAKDLSEQGMALTASRPFATKTILDIQLKLPTAEETIELEGEVVSCNEIRQNIVYAIGVKFVNLQQEQEEALSKFMQLYLNE